MSVICDSCPLVCRRQFVMKSLHLWIVCLVTLLTAAEVFAGKIAGRQLGAENVERRTVSIFSDGVRMAGDLYLPKGLKPGDKLPVIVCCNGTGGTKGGTAARLGLKFASDGFIVPALVSSRANLRWIATASASGAVATVAAS